MMNKITLHQIRKYFISVFLASLLSFCGPRVAGADEPMLVLGEHRLFMSSEQRDELDRQPVKVIVPSDPPIVSDLPVKAVTVRRKPRTVKVTLHGAVIRPDGNAIVFLNKERRIIAQQQRSVSAELVFRVEFKNKLVKLKPGQSVQVSTDRE